MKSLLRHIQVFLKNVSNGKENTHWNLKQRYFKLKRFYGDSKVSYPMGYLCNPKCGSLHSQTIYIKLILISTSSLASSGNLIAHGYKSQQGERDSITLQNIPKFAAYAVLLPEMLLTPDSSQCFLHCSFSHILVLSNAFPCRERILCFQYHACHLLMQRKTTLELFYTLVIFLWMLLVFLTTFFP